MINRVYIPIIILSAAVMVNALHCLFLKSKIKAVQDVVSYQTIILKNIVKED